jgi:hypothetical protein
MDAMLRKGWLEVDGPAKGRTHFRVTAEGEHALRERGVDFNPAVGSRRMYAYGCVDWTERRFHLGGALAAGILDSLCDAGVIQRISGTRIVSFLEPITYWLDEPLP